MSLSEIYNVVDAAQMHVSKCAFCKVLINNSRVNGFIGVLYRVGLVMCDPGFVENLPILSYGILRYNDMWCNFSMWEMECKIRGER